MRLGSFVRRGAVWGVSVSRTVGSARRRRYTAALPPIYPSVAHPRSIAGISPVISDELLPLGISDFREIKENGRLFVDKSKFIEEFVLRGAHAKLITRPQGFGKSFNLSMLRYFLDIKYRDLSEEWFSGLMVSRNPSAMMHRGKYPVLFLDMNHMNPKTYKDFERELAARMLELYESSAPKLKDEYEDKSFALQVSRLRELSRCSSASDHLTHTLNSSLKDLTRFVYKSSGLRPYVLIDGYDTPAHRFDNPYVSGEAVDDHWSGSGPYSKLFFFMMSFLGDAFKGNTYLEKGLITAQILVPLWDGMILGGANNISWDRPDDVRYAEHFGFTEQEVHDLYKRYTKRDIDPETLSLLRRWYGGYTFGEAVVSTNVPPCEYRGFYNPRSIVQCFSRDMIDVYMQPEDLHVMMIKHAYFTSSLISLKSSARWGLLSTYRIEHLFGLLLGHAGLRFEPHRFPGSGYGSFSKKASDISGLMLYCGYISFIKDEKGKAYKMPNYETMAIFGSICQDWLVEKTGVEPELYQALPIWIKRNDISKFFASLQLILTRGRCIFSQSQYLVDFVHKLIAMFITTQLREDYTINVHYIEKADNVMSIIPSERLQLESGNSAISLISKCSDTTDVPDAQSTLHGEFDGLLHPEIARIFHEGILPKRVLNCAVLIRDYKVYYDTELLEYNGDEYVVLEARKGLQLAGKSLGPSPMSAKHGVKCFSEMAKRDVKTSTLPEMEK